MLAAEAADRVMALEAAHTLDPALDAAMVLLEALVQVGAGPVMDGPAQHAADRPRVGAMPVRRHPVRSDDPPPGLRTPLIRSVRAGKCLMAKTRREFTPEFKREAVALLAGSGRPQMHIAAELAAAAPKPTRSRTRAAAAPKAPQAKPPEPVSHDAPTAGVEADAEDHEAAA